MNNEIINNANKDFWEGRGRSNNFCLSNENLLIEHIVLLCVLSSVSISIYKSIHYLHKNTLFNVQISCICYRPYYGIYKKNLHILVGTFYL